MMKLSEEQLTDLQEHASNLMKRKEICLIMEIELEQFNAELMDEKSPVYRAYFAGLLLTKSEIHKSVITLAKSGSSPAQTMASKMLTDVTSEIYD